MKRSSKCPNCGHSMEVFKNPVPTVDIIIRLGSRGIVLIKRKNPPYGWAMPGGFIDYGESAETAAQREALEETKLRLEDLKQFHVYSRPDRDPRGHTLTVVFSAKGLGDPSASDDAYDLGVFSIENLPKEMAFDHRDIILDYFLERL